MPGGLEVPSAEVILDRQQGRSSGAYATNAPKPHVGSRSAVTAPSDARLHEDHLIMTATHSP